MTDCNTIHCIRHWCRVCGEVIDHEYMVCPGCGEDYTHEETPERPQGEPYYDNDDSDLKVVRLGPILDEMEF